MNPKLMEGDAESFSASAKKVKLNSDVPENGSTEYRVINFLTVFTTISTFVKCKDCGRAVQFGTASTRGLGFKITILCDTCPTRHVQSCPLIKNTYEVNRRFVFTMRLLGLGLKGAQRFCGLMDMPAFLCQATYDMLVKNIHGVVKSVTETSFHKAVEEEIEETSKNMGAENSTDLIVSGDGTWKKRGFNSLYGVSSIIGFYSGKVLDVLTKSLYCKMCESWDKRKGTVEYEEWFETHASKCQTNHTGSSGKMEADAMIEMFQRSEEMYGVRYKNYIGDGDSKTYSQIVKSNPYENTTVVKKKCIGHVQKRMGSRLRACKKNNKGIGGKGKLTGKMIDKLTVYYGLAIKRNSDSVEKMKNDIWATFDHYRSTDKHPFHDKCPTGSESWCSWQRARAEGTLDDFQHEYKALPDDVLKVIKPIYQNLSKDELLQRCVGGFNQNNNESLNQLIWKITPKVIPCGSLIVEIAAYTASAMFNEGHTVLLKFFEALGISCGRNMHSYIRQEDKSRIEIAERRVHENTREARMLRRQQQIKVLEAVLDVEGVSYGPGIDDSA